MSTMSENAFFQKFVAVASDGKIDMKKAENLFKEAFGVWLKSQAEVKPAILKELGKFGRLGEQKLISYALHSLDLHPTTENAEKVKAAIAELEHSGRIVYQTTENGHRRGRAAGYVVAGQNSKNGTLVVPAV